MMCTNCLKMQKNLYTTKEYNNNNNNNNTTTCRYSRMPKLCVCTLRSPEMLAPARIPVAAGKKTAKTVKKLCSVPSNLRKSGRKFPANVSPTTTPSSVIDMCQCFSDRILRYVPISLG